MSWRDNYQPASFRGVAFHVEAASGKGGRRVVVHEYPNQEVHSTEDLGKLAGPERLQAFVIGDDYDQTRERLMAALNLPGPGTLVHPYLGTLRIQVKEFEWNISTRKGGMCKFTISYVPAGQRKYPVADPANARALESAADNATTATEAAFEQEFTVEGMPQFVADDAADTLGDALNNLRTINGQITAAMQPLSDLANDIDQLGNEISTLILQPRTLAMRVGGVVASLFGAYTDIKDAFKGYKGLLAGFGIVDPPPAKTPSRQRQAKNQAAISSLLIATLVVGVARIVANQKTPFATYDQAMEIRDELLQQLDDLMETATDEQYIALVELQATIVRRVQDVAPGLQRIEQIQLQHTVPALVLAHQLYGTATQADELVSRNQVTNPLFMPAGTDLEVLK